MGGFLCQNHNGSGQIKIVSTLVKLLSESGTFTGVHIPLAKKGHMTKFVINGVNIYKASSSQGPIEEGMTILNINIVYHRKQVEKPHNLQEGIYALSKKNLQDGRGKNSPIMSISLTSTQGHHSHEFGVNYALVFFMILPFQVYS